MAAGGAALALTPQGRGIVSDLFGDGDQVDVTADQLNAAISDTPAGQQPSTVRTYTEQNESYMGSRAGNELRKNTPKTGQLYSSPSAAAAATKVTVKTVLAKDPIRHLASRTTFGINTKTTADIKRMGIDRWLRWQLEPDKIAPTPAELKLAEHATYNLTIQQLREQREALNQKDAHADQEVIQTTIARQIWSDRQLFEVMVDFWNDFLHVAAFFDGGEMTRASFDRDVIRKHALGSYADMLVAANRHPALLVYLNQNQSTKDRVNENLARENLELYSVGVDGGYTERDVKQAALLQTGRDVRDDEYVYRPEAHYVGPVKIMGFKHANSSAEGGEAAAEAYFRYLALHKSTARYIAINLATRFVSDTPPKTLVDRLAKSYTTNKGRIKPVLMTLFSSSEFWASVGQKVRRPMEYLTRHLPHAGRPAGGAAGLPAEQPEPHAVHRGTAADPQQDGGARALPVRHAHAERIPGHLRRVDVGRNDDQRLERGQRHHPRQPPDVRLHGAGEARRGQAAGHRRRLPRRAVQEAGAPEALRQGEDPAARHRRGRLRRACRRDVQRRRRRDRPRHARIPAAPPPVRPKMEKKLPMSDHPKFAVHPDCPDVRRLGGNRFERMLRAEAAAVEAENLAERDKLRMLNDLEEQQQDGRGVTRRTFVAGAAAVTTALATTQFVSTRASFAATPTGTLIHVFLYGGLDGLALVAPANDPVLARVRPDLLLAENGSIALDRNFMLSGAFAPLQRFLDAGQLGFVPAVTDPRLSLSHFQAADACNLGGLPGETGGRGFLDSLVDALGPGTAFRSVGIGNTLPRSLVGTNGALALSSVGSFNLNGDDRFKAATAKAIGGLFTGINHPVRGVGARRSRAR